MKLEEKRAHFADQRYHPSIDQIATLHDDGKRYFTFDFFADALKMWMSSSDKDLESILQRKYEIDFLSADEMEFDGNKVIVKKESSAEMFLFFVEPNSTDGRFLEDGIQKIQTASPERFADACNSFAKYIIFKGKPYFMRMPDSGNPSHRFNFWTSRNLDNAVPVNYPQNLVEVLQEEWPYKHGFLRVHPKENGIFVTEHGKYVSNQWDESVYPFDELPILPVDARAGRVVRKKSVGDGLGRKIIDPRSPLREGQEWTMRNGKVTTLLAPERDGRFRQDTKPGYLYCSDGKVFAESKEEEDLISLHCEAHYPGELPVDERLEFGHQDIMGQKKSTQDEEGDTMSSKAGTSEDTRDTPIEIRSYEEETEDLKEGFVPARMYLALEAKVEKVRQEVQQKASELAEARAELKHIKSGRTIEDATVEAIQKHHQEQATTIALMSSKLDEKEEELEELINEKHSMLALLEENTEKIKDLERVRAKQDKAMEFMRQELFPYLSGGEEDLAEEANDRLCSMEEEMVSLRLENAQILEMLQQVLEGQEKKSCGPCGFKEDLLPDKFTLHVGAVKEKEDWMMKWLKMSERGVTVFRIVMKILIAIALVAGGYFVNALNFL